MILVPIVGFHAVLFIWASVSLYCVTDSWDLVCMFLLSNLTRVGCMQIYLYLVCFLATFDCYSYGFQGIEKWSCWNEAWSITMDFCTFAETPNRGFLSFFLSFFVSPSIFHLLSYIAFSSSGMCSTTEMIKLIVDEKIHRLVKYPSVNFGWPFQW